MTRYFQDLLSPARPIFPQQGTALPSDPDERAMSIMKARSHLSDRIVAAKEAAKSFQEANGSLTRVAQARILRDAGVTFQPAKLQMMRADEAEFEAIEQKARRAIETARSILDPIIREQMQRMQMAIASVNSEPEEPAPLEDAELEAEIQLVEEQTSPQEKIRMALMALSQAFP